MEIKQKEIKIEAGEYLIWLHLSDSEFHEDYLVITRLTENEIKKEITKTVKNFEESELLYDWCYDDIIENLEEKGLIKLIKIDKYYSIYV